MTDDLDLRRVIAELSATRDAYARIIDAIDAANAASMSDKQRQRAREARAEAVLHLELITPDLLDRADPRELRNIIALLKAGGGNPVAIPH